MYDSVHTSHVTRHTSHVTRHGRLHHSQLTIHNSSLRIRPCLLVSLSPCLLVSLSAPTPTPRIYEDSQNKPVVLVGASACWRLWATTRVRPYRYRDIFNLHNPMALRICPYLKYTSNRSRTLPRAPEHDILAACHGDERSRRGRLFRDGRP